MKYIKYMLYKPFLMLAICASIYSPYTYTADKLNVPRRSRMPSPKPYKSCHELNNEILIIAEDPDTPIVVHYSKKKGPDCSGSYYASGRTAILAYCGKFKNCVAEKKPDQSSEIKLTCSGSHNEYLFTAQDHDEFTVKSQQDNQIIITKKGFGEVAIFTLQPIKQRQQNNDHPIFELIQGDDGISRIVQKKGP